MTTEVLRNMLYAGSSALRGLSHVVMDEVHYLADRFRGGVWEEVILALPEPVRLVSLSATVSNAEEFGEWLETVRGDTAVIVEEHRPVPLWQSVLVGRRLYDLFADPARPATAAPAEVNRELVRLRAEQSRADHSRVGPGQRGRAPSRSAGPAAPGGSTPRGRAGSGCLRVPRSSRSSTARDCCRRSRSSSAGPAATRAVAQCLSAGLRLATPDERTRIRAHARERTADLSDADLRVLGYWEWLDGLERGIAAHHAGLLPRFKEITEELFAEGLVKAVFATETLALGINMPARSVVLERLVKYNGETHVELTAGEYTQLTGRAGRRGIDVEGHAVVLWTTGLRSRAGRRARVDPDVSAALVVPAVVQHGGQPGGVDGPGRRPGAAGVVVRPVPGRPGGGRAGPPGAPPRRGDRRLRGGDALRARFGAGVRGAAPPALARGRRSWPGSARRSAGCGPTNRCAGCVPVTSSGCRRDAAPGSRSCSRTVRRSPTPAGWSC